MNRPVVSVIVTTRNNASTLGACLASVRAQTYQPLELIVVDNGSGDDTKAIAATYADGVFDKEPERSAQRNYGVSRCAGQYVLIIDSDMELPPDVVAACVTAVNAKERAVIIPELSFGTGFWARCKALERSFYDGVDWIEAPRFFSTPLYRSVGGYDETMSGGEDWDLTARVRQQTGVARVKPRIRHNEGHLRFKDIVGKRAYYTKGFTKYYAKPKTDSPMKGKVGQVVGTYRLLLSHPAKLFHQPLVGVGTLIMKTAEFAAIAIALAASKNNSKSVGETA